MLVEPFSTNQCRLRIPTVDVVDEVPHRHNGVAVAEEFVAHVVGVQAYISETRTLKGDVLSTG